ncbi:MAG: prolipoprotein diacylglyceryl transferase, partial [Omnitrophica WOR_2 bacterium]
LAAYIAEREARRRGLNGDLVWDGLIWVLVGGILGARIWHILTPPPSMVAQGITTLYYLSHPLDAIAIWKGGLGIPGAVIGGIIALFFFTRRNKLNFATWVDIAAPALALGQSIGRWGNFFNQELYGAPTNLPWGIYIDPAHRLPGYENVSRYHPTFLYESIWNLLNMFFLLWIARRFADRLKPGDVFLTYLIVYPVGRFFLEFLRLDSSRVAGINANQTLALIVTILAAVALFLRHRPGTQALNETMEPGQNQE